MPYLSVEAEVDYDPSDFWCECSSIEKEELVDLAIEEGLASPAKGSGNVGISVVTTSYTEEELAKLLSDLWENRAFIDIKIVDELRENLRNKNLV